MSTLSIFKVEKDSSDEYDAVRVELCEGDPNEAVISFNRLVFQNQHGMLYNRLVKKCGDGDEWEANDDYSDCVKVAGACGIMPCEPGYRYYKEKGKMKVDKERVVKRIRVVSLKDSSTWTAESGLQAEVIRYENNRPDAAKIAEDAE